MAGRFSPTRLLKFPNRLLCTLPLDGFWWAQWKALVSLFQPQTTSSPTLTV